MRPTSRGCELTDVVEIEPRLTGSVALTRWAAGRVFDRRHRVLTDRFGG